MDIALESNGTMVTCASSYDVRYPPTSIIDRYMRNVLQYITIYKIYIDINTHTSNKHSYALWQQLLYLNSSLL